MKITVINGTSVKGCTYHIKEKFLSVLRDGNEITEFYLPKDMPEFCTGCKSCFVSGENNCPHCDYVLPVWNAVLDADLVVFAYPVYVFHAPGSVKALLDHFGVHWLVHRPDRRMFKKRAVIITNSIGSPNGTAQKDVKTSLTWMGVSSIKCLGIRMIEGVIWKDISDSSKAKIEKKAVRLAKKFVSCKPAMMNLKVWFLFYVCKALHKSTLKREKTVSLDNMHYIQNGWIRP